MKSVVICGSKRFKPEMQLFAEELQQRGIVVYQPHLHTPAAEWDALSPTYKKFVALGLTHDHFYKIQMADVVFIFNKDGYMGNSVTLEIGYAVALGKPIYALNHDDNEICRDILFRDIISTSAALADTLQ